MAQPKKKTSHQKQAQRRAVNYLKTPIATLTTCPQCGEPMRPHQVCNGGLPSRRGGCGYYRGRPARLSDNVTLE